MTWSTWTPAYDAELAHSAPPSASLETRYGRVTFFAHSSTRGRADGWLDINNARHHVTTMLIRGDDGAWRLDCGEALGNDDDAASRRRAVQIRRREIRRDSSDSARRRAAIELERAITDWGRQPDSASVLASGEEWGRAFDLARLHGELADVVGTAAKARRRANEIREEMAALAGLPDASEPSRISLAEAARHYRDFLGQELHSAYGLLDDGEPIAPDALLAALLGLDRLIRLEHTADRDASPRRWDTVQALAEAPFA